MVKNRIRNNFSTLIILLILILITNCQTNLDGGLDSSTSLQFQTILYDNTSSYGTTAYFGPEVALYNGYDEMRSAISSFPSDIYNRIINASNGKTGSFIFYNEQCISSSCIPVTIQRLKKKGTYDLLLELRNNCPTNTNVINDCNAFLLVVYTENTYYNVNISYVTQ